VHTAAAERSVSFFQLELPPGARALASMPRLECVPGRCRWCGVEDGSKRTWCRGWNWGIEYESLPDATRAALIGQKPYGYWRSPCANAAYSWWFSATALRRAVFRRDGFTCRQCGAAPTLVVAGRVVPDLSQLHADHVRPLAAGGKTTWENLQTLCARDNLTKGARVETAHAV
jgi:hypothetical protein